jgi:hypothetical protein
MEPQYDDQISEHIVDFLLFQALQLQPLKHDEPKRQQKTAKPQLDQAVELFVSNVVPMPDLKTPRQQDPALLKLFEEHGRVAKIKFVAQTLDEDTVKAYVEYANDPKAPERAIKGLNGVEFRGEKLVVEYLADAKYRRRREMKTQGVRPVRDTPKPTKGKDHGWGADYDEDEYQEDELNQQMDDYDPYRKDYGYADEKPVYRVKEQKPKPAYE